jgi:hypothetical protein
VPVVLVIVGLIVLAAVVYAAMGRGGELSAERTDHAPLELGPVSATDVALLRPPSAAWGYDMQTTDEALERIADAMRQRDVRIVALEQLVTDLSRNPAPAPLGSPFPAARRAVEPPEPAAARDTLAAAPVPEPAPPAERQPQQQQSRQEQQQQKEQSQQRQQLRQPPPERSHG